MTDDVRVSALRGAVAELLQGYSEVARLMPDNDLVLAPLRRAADNAAAALAQAS